MNLLELGWHFIKNYVKGFIIVLVILFVTAGLLTAEANDEVTIPVKMSKSEICHAEDSPYYDRTKTFTIFETLDECIEAGGRLPKNYTPKVIETMETA